MSAVEFFCVMCLSTVLNEHIDEINSYQVAGDWLTYIYTLARGKIAFTAQSLNRHRRHETSVTLSSFNISQLQEIVRIQKRVREEFLPNKSVIEQAVLYAQQLYQAI